MITRNKGMQIYAAICGIVNVVTTKIRHMAATNAMAKMIGMAAQMIAKKGLPKLLLSSSFLTSYGVILIPPENRTKKITAAIRIKYIIQQ